MDLNQELRNGLISFIQQFRDVMQIYQQDQLEKTREILNDTLAVFAKCVRDQLAELQVTYADKDRIVFNIAKWGTYGWTLMEFAPFDIYCRPVPNTGVEADVVAMEHCSDEAVDRVIESIGSVVVAKDDFCDAVFCYKKRTVEALRDAVILNH